MVRMGQVRGGWEKMRSEKKQEVQAKQSLVGHCKDFGFGSVYDGNLQRIFE